MAVCAEKWKIFFSTLVLYSLETYTYKRNLTKSSVTSSCKNRIFQFFLKDNALQSASWDGKELGGGVDKAGKQMKGWGSRPYHFLTNPRRAWATFKNQSVIFFLLQKSITHFLPLVTLVTRMEMAQRWWISAPKKGFGSKKNPKSFPVPWGGGWPFFGRSWPAFTTRKNAELDCGCGRAEINCTVLLANVNIFLKHPLGQRGSWRTFFSSLNQHPKRALCTAVLLLLYPLPWLIASPFSFCHRTNQ